MAYQVIVYVVTELVPTGGEKVVALRLTNEAARGVAKEKPNRAVEKMIATK